MGYLHVIVQGKGFYLYPIRISDKFILPPKEDLEKIVTDRDLNIIDNLNLIETISYLFMNKSSFSHLKNTYEVLSADNVKEFINKYLGEDYCYDYIVVNSLAPLFCYEYGYPQGSFTSINDYNGDNMIFCSIIYPPKEYNEKLALLTENILEKQLQEFMYKLTGDELYKIQKLELCECYAKD